MLCSEASGCEERFLNCSCFQRSNYGERGFRYSPVYLNLLQRLWAFGPWPHPQRRRRTWAGSYPLGRREKGIVIFIYLPTAKLSLNLNVQKILRVQGKCSERFGFYAEWHDAQGLESNGDQTSRDKTARIKKGSLKIPAVCCPRFLSFLKAAKKEIAFLGSFAARWTESRKQHKNTQDEFIWQHSPIAKMLFATVFQHFSPINLSLSPLIQQTMTAQRWIMRETSLTYRAHSTSSQGQKGNGPVKSIPAHILWLPPVIVNVHISHRQHLCCSLCNNTASSSERDTDREVELHLMQRSCICKHSFPKQPQFQVCVDLPYFYF